MADRVFKKMRTLFGDLCLVAAASTSEDSNI
jgi:hypothetical protein